MPKPAYVIDLASDLITTLESEGSAKSCVNYIAFWKAIGNPLPKSDLLATVAALLSAGF